MMNEKYKEILEQRSKMTEMEKHYYDLGFSIEEINCIKNKKGTNIWNIASTPEIAKHIFNKYLEN